MNLWIDWVKQIKAISQIGQSYSKDPYDQERYEQLAQIAHEMLAHLTDAPIGKIENFFIPDKGYATPKVDLRAGIFKNDKILLVKEKLDNKWSLPGGWADVCESPRQGIQREVREESGFDVRVDRLVAIKDRSLHPYEPQYPDHLFKLFFLCTLTGGQAQENIEIAEIAFFPLDQLPPLSTQRILEEDLQMLWQYQQGELEDVYCD